MRAKSESGKTIEIEITNRIPKYLDAKIQAIEDSALKICIIKIIGFLVWCAATRETQKRGEIFSISSKALKQHAGPRYHKAIKWLINQGNVFTFISGELNDRKEYKSGNPQFRGYRFGNDDKSNVTKRYGFTNLFIKSIKSADFEDYPSIFEIQVRENKEAIAEERQKVAATIEKETDDFVKHVRTSIERASFPENALEQFAKENSGHGAAASIQIALSINNKTASLAYRTDKVGKIYSPLCSMSSDLRKEILIDNEKTVELDLRSSHIYLMLEHLLFEGSEATVIDHLKTGDFWTSFMSSCDLLIPKTEFKQLFFRSLSSLNEKSKDAGIIKMKSIINLHFPKLFQTVRKLEAGEKATLQAFLQNSESQVIDSFISFCSQRNIPVIPIYDSVILKASDENLAYEFFGSRIRNKGVETTPKPLSELDTMKLQYAFLDMLD